MPEETCESCDRVDGDVQPVRRVYVTPESWDQEGKAEVQPDIERWCFSCRSHYPHEEVAG